MEAISSVFAALGVAGYDALNDLAHWLDGDAEPTASAETDHAHAAGWEG